MAICPGDGRPRRGNRGPLALILASRAAAGALAQQGTVLGRSFGLGGQQGPAVPSAGPSSSLPSAYPATYPAYASPPLPPTAAAAAAPAASSAGSPPAYLQPAAAAARAAPASPGLPSASVPSQLFSGLASEQAQLFETLALARRASCMEVLELVVNIRLQALQSLRSLRAALEPQGRDAVALNVHLASSAVSSAVFGAAQLVASRQECLPWIAREPLLLMLDSWKKLFTELLELCWEEVHFGIDPAAGGEGAQARMTKILHQLEAEIHQDAQTSSIMLQEYVAGAVKPQIGIRGHDADEVIMTHARGDRKLRPPASAGCSDDGYELLRRETFGNWKTDKGLMRQLVQELWSKTGEDGEEVGSAISVADVCGGGGTHAALLNASGFIEAHSYGPSNLATDITGGRVISLPEGSKGFPKADWLICLGAGPKSSVGGAAQLLTDLASSAKKGALVVWEPLEPCRGDFPYIKLDEGAAGLGDLAHFGIILDQAATERLRGASDTAAARMSAWLFRVGEASGRPANPEEAAAQIFSKARADLRTALAGMVYPFPTATSR